MQWGRERQRDNVGYKHTERKRERERWTATKKKKKEKPAQHYCRSPLSFGTQDKDCGESEPS